MLLAGAFGAHAGPPDVINYKGLLRDSAGSPVTADLDIRFTLYDAAVGGNTLWTSAWTAATGGPVRVADGAFAVELGSRASLSDIDFSRQLYLSVRVADDQEMTPRLRIGGVPFAFQAGSRPAVVSVDCDTGGRIEQALDEAPLAGSLTVDISGTCDEDILITRDNLALTTSGSARVRGQGGGDIVSAITIDGASNVVLDGLIIEGPAQGYGLVVRENGALSLSGVAVTGGVGGVHALQGGFVSIDASSTVETGGRYGVLVTGGAGAFIADATITADNSADRDNGALGCFRGSYVRLRNGTVLRNRGPDRIPASGDEGNAVKAWWSCSLDQAGSTTSIQGRIHLGAGSSGMLRNVAIDGDLVVTGAYLRIENRGGATSLTAASIQVTQGTLELVSPESLDLANGTVTVVAGSAAIFSNADLSAPGLSSIYLSVGALLLLGQGTDWIVQGGGADGGIDLNNNATLVVGDEGIASTLETSHDISVNSGSALIVNEGSQFTSSGLRTAGGGRIDGGNGAVIEVNGRLQMSMFSQLSLDEGARLSLGADSGTYHYVTLSLEEGARLESSADVSLRDTRVRARDDVGFVFSNNALLSLGDARIDGGTGFSFGGRMQIDADSGLNLEGPPTFSTGTLNCDYTGGVTPRGPVAICDPDSFTIVGCDLECAPSP